MKTKHQIKGIIIGLLIGVLISLSVFVTSASNGTVTLENVLMEGITIVIDNKEFTATDANGNIVKPMIYNGTTYLPVRAVATAFEKAVSWDAETKTVYLGDMDGKLEKPTAKFADLENISEDRMGFEVKKNIFDNYGGFYSAAINNDDFWSNDTGTPFETLLNKKYSTFKATLFVPKGSGWSTSPYITIIGDDKVLYTSAEMDKAAKPVDIEVDISGVNNFKIVFSHFDGIYMANEGFYQ